MPYQQLLKEADPDIAKQINVETFVRKYANITRGLDELDRTFAEVNPDVVVVFGDDQGEMFFDDNYPSISVFWGETCKFIPHMGPNGERPGSPIPYGYEEREYPVDSALGLHIIESLMDRDFDLGHMRYHKDEYGGSIGPSTWYHDFQRNTKPRHQGLGHAWGFPVHRWFHGKDVPIVPIIMNTCYPPNWISPRRAYQLGRAVHDAVLAWDSDKRVAMACSGGLSHFVVDEELDRIAIKGMEEANGEALSNLPRVRLQSATTETLNWVATSGAMGDTHMETLCYEPGYRTLAGTGCGCGVGRWTV